jgi:hypothetical protein
LNFPADEGVRGVHLATSNPGKRGSKRSES